MTADGALAAPEALAAVSEASTTHDLSLEAVLRELAELRAAVTWEVPVRDVVLVPGDGIPARLQGAPYESVSIRNETTVAVWASPIDGLAAQSAGGYPDEHAIFVPASTIVTEPVAGKTLELAQAPGGADLRVVVYRWPRVVSPEYAVRLGTVNVSRGAIRTHGQNTIDAAAEQVLAAAINRRSVWLKNASAVGTITIGVDNTVTAANGWPLGPGEGMVIDESPNAAVWAIADAAGRDLRFFTET